MLILGATMPLMPARRDIVSLERLRCELVLADTVYQLILFVPWYVLL